MTYYYYFEIYENIIIISNFGAKFFFSKIILKKFMNK